MQGQASASSELAPSSSWTGVAGSGFATVPSDPERLTAKPALRMIEPPNQWFTDTLTIGAMAYANDGGTLIGGVDRVRFHYEGNTLDVLQPTLRTLTRHDGSTYQCLGYWCDLEKPEGVSGNAELYVEAIPSDATMQRRVIGPYSFCPVQTLHDFALTVAPSLPVLGGSNYHDLGSALNYLKGQGAQNPRITITEAAPTGFYGLPSVGSNYAGGTGRCLIEATVPVTFGYPGYNSDSGSSAAGNTMRPRYGGLHFKGTNITFDARFIARIVHEGLGEYPWFDRVAVTVSGNGRAELWRAGPRPLPEFAEDGSWWTECAVEFVNDPFKDARLARGCTAHNGYNDVCGNTLGALHNIITDWTSLDDWQQYVPAIEVSGPAGATLSVSGSNDANSRTITVKENGATIGSFAVGKSEALYSLASIGGYDPVSAGQGYFIQDVADWLNSLTGWAASVLDNSRRASALAFGQDKGRAFSDVDVSAPFTFSTYFDLHTDLFKQNTGGPQENVIWANNLANGIKAQTFFVTETLGAQDWIIVNNAVQNEPDGNLIQFSYAHSHVVFAHNSITDQSMLLRSSEDYTPDDYTLIANNAVPDISWSIAGVLGTGVIRDNVLDEGAVAPAGATGTVLAGSSSSKFSDAWNFDFSPAGELLTNLKTPVVRRSLSGTGRANPTAVGAL